MAKSKKPAVSRRLPVTGGMRVDTYSVLQTAVDSGVAYGWMRAHKHTAKPGAAVIQETIFEAVMNSICEQFKFNEDKEEL